MTLRARSGSRCTPPRGQVSQGESGENINNDRRPREARVFLPTRLDICRLVDGVSLTALGFHDMALIERKIKFHAAFGDFYPYVITVESQDGFFG